MVIINLKRLFMSVRKKKVGNLEGHGFKAISQKKNIPCSQFLLERIFCPYVVFSKASLSKRQIQNLFKEGIVANMNLDT